MNSVITSRCVNTKVAKEKYYDAKEPISICDVKADNIVISNLIETRNISKLFIICLDEVIWPLIFLLPKISTHVIAFKEKNNKLMYFSMDDKKLLEKYKTVCTKAEDLKILSLMIYQFMVTDTVI